jgi:arylsulfatase A-like enzyme
MRAINRGGGGAGLAAQPRRPYLLLLFVVLPLLASHARSGSNPPPHPPSIVFILSDDQRFDTLGCAGNRVIRTPNLDRLARDGVRFRNAFVTTPICAASRASFFTGLWERTHRCTFQTEPLLPPFAAFCYPKRLRQAGYRTGFVGKFGIDLYPGDTAEMFDYFAPVHRSPYLKRMPDGTVRHETDLAGDAAVRFIDNCYTSQPFCLSVSFNAPHAEDADPAQYFWSEQEDELYRTVFFPTPRTMSESFFNRQPEFLRHSESRVRFNWRFNEPRKYQEMVRGYYRMITGIDRVVGRIRRALEGRGLDRNTILVFMSDNGYFLGERGFADKWYGYEYSLRVPAIVLDPRLPSAMAGRVLDEPILNVDVAPTLLDWAGASVPAEMQGRSFAGLVSGERLKWRDRFFFEHLFTHRGIPRSEGVRTSRWTYIRWRDRSPVVEELYDHQADFEQEHNLVGDPERRGVLRALRQATDGHISRLLAARRRIAPGAGDEPLELRPTASPGAGRSSGAAADRSRGSEATRAAGRARGELAANIVTGE